ncbi:hypothetical protein J8273_0278 [Carpediemonas membranifera]|uniref:Uncharacterized protein n=1 Tax=Carpediemonas membranifera TaxID=201153 RepID=A0A8J6E4X6_9EUKA|nr:hypothetical protein J8273_0278 [Carpediemonas membranifera]|eukprot:KAG9395062.1 hypothetical protein J8273_0278 [Carpediemonas membranifera]
MLFKPILTKSDRERRLVFLIGEVSRRSGNVRVLTHMREAYRIEFDKARLTWTEISALKARRPDDCGHRTLDDVIDDIAALRLRSDEAHVHMVMACGWLSGRASVRLYPPAAPLDLGPPAGALLVTPVPPVAWLSQQTTQRLVRQTFGKGVTAYTFLFRRLWADHGPPTVREEVAGPADEGCT